MRSVFIGLAVIVAVLAQSPTLQHACWKQSTTRGAGDVLSACPQGLEKQNGLCYPPCQNGFSGVGPVCWSNCPAGYEDNGAFCSEGGPIIPADNSNCPWYDKCGLTLKKGCSTCPPNKGYVNDGCTCRIPLNTITKTSYGRGAGVPMICPSGSVQSGALCYPPCNGTFVGNGPVCWQQCSTLNSYPVVCGAMCGVTGFNCTAQIEAFEQLALQEVLACATGPTQACIEGIAALAKDFALDGLCPSN
eukprot:PhF_6_TR21891/c0_g1_i1/m.31087